MGSVLDLIECPNCKQEAHIDFYYKTGEEYVTCTNCGYYRSATIKNRDKKLNELTDEDWEIQELKNPYGAYRLKVYHNPCGELGTLENEEQYNDLKKSIKTDVEIEFCSISRLVDNEIVTEVIIDNGPDYDSAGFSTLDR